MPLRPAGLLKFLLGLSLLLKSLQAQDRQNLPQRSSDWPIRQVALPADRSYRIDADLPQGDQLRDTLDESAEPAKSTTQQPPRRYFAPRFDFSAEWASATDGIAVSSLDGSVQQGLPPCFGPPPPLLNAGYSITLLNAPTSFELPGQLHEFSAGASWMRRINDHWMARFMISGAFASDLENTGRDAWQIRGGAFALFRPNDEWSWAMGALVTGRDDLPVLPAVGAIWQPTHRFKANLMMPTPRLSVLLRESADRQHWAYLGAALTGGTWAVRNSTRDDRLTYREWRGVLGWEVVPPQAPGTFVPAGTAWNSEIGIAFGRSFEFDRNDRTIELSSALLLRTGIRF